LIFETVEKEKAGEVVSFHRPRYFLSPIRPPNLRCNVNCTAQPFSHGEPNPPQSEAGRLVSKQCQIWHVWPTASSWIHKWKVRWTMKKLHPNCPPKGAPIRFARSVIHWRSGKRIYPKTAKAFPLRGKRGDDKRQLTLAV
jgi:hypothetical protein